jgi:hypothetical protein
MFDTFDKPTYFRLSEDVTFTLLHISNNFPLCIQDEIKYYVLFFAQETAAAKELLAGC